MTLPRLALALLLAVASPALAETADKAPVAEASVDQLSEVLQLDALFQVLREEGLGHGDMLEADMFPAGGGAEWIRT